MRGESWDSSARGGTDRFDDSQVQNSSGSSGSVLVGPFSGTQGLKGPSAAAVVPQRNRVDHYGRTTIAYFPRLNSIATLEARLATLRIPEVQGRLRAAQLILDDLGSGAHGDLTTWMLADDCDFESELGLKDVIELVVQVALYERYLRFNRTPDCMIGAAARLDSGTLSVAAVCADLGSFGTAIRSSRLAKNWIEKATVRLPEAIEQFSVPEPVAEEDGAIEPAKIQRTTPGCDAFVGAPQLDALPMGIGRPLKLVSGAAEIKSRNQGLQEPSELEAEWVEGAAAKVSELDEPSTAMEFFKRNDSGVWDLHSELSGSHLEVVQALCLDLGSCRFVSFGISEGVTSAEAVELNMTSEGGEITIDSAIDLDPYLSWFWRDLRPFGTEVQ